MILSFHNDEFEEIVRGKVKIWGNSAHIPIGKKYNGEEVLILILSEKGKEKISKKYNEEYNKTLGYPSIIKNSRNFENETKN